MKLTRLLLSALFVAATATPAFAQGVAGISWNTCTGPIDRAVTPGQTSVALNASVVGHAEPHKAYQVWLAIGSGPLGALRDAWRFDATGCQGSSFITINHLAPAALVKACPSFQGALQSLQIKDYSFDPVTGRARAVLANSYPAGNSTQVVPVQRYFLAQFLFDHSFSTNDPSDPGVTCGDLDVAICVHVTVASWLSLDGVETPWAVNPEYLTTNDSNQAQDPCGFAEPVPAVNSTWGAIKAQYKR